MELSESGKNFVQFLEDQKMPGLTTTKFIMKNMPSFHLPSYCFDISVAEGNIDERTKSELIETDDERMKSEMARIHRCLSLAVEAEWYGGLLYWIKSIKKIEGILDEHLMKEFFEWWKEKDRTSEAKKPIREVAKILISWMEETGNIENPDEKKLFRDFGEFFFNPREGLRRNFPNLYMFDYR